VCSFEKFERKIVSDMAKYGQGGLYEQQLWKADRSSQISVGKGRWHIRECGKSRRLEYISTMWTRNDGAELLSGV